MISTDTASQGNLLLNALTYMENPWFVEIRNILNCRTLDAGYLSWATLHLLEENCAKTEGPVQ